MTTKTIFIYIAIAAALYFIIKYAYNKGAASVTPPAANPASATQRQRCPDGQCLKTKTVGDITYSGCYPCNSASI